MKYIIDNTEGKDFWNEIIEKVELIKDWDVKVYQLFHYMTQTMNLPESTEIYWKLTVDSGNSRKVLIGLKAKSGTRVWTDEYVETWPHDNFEEVAKRILENWTSYKGFMFQQSQWKPLNYVDIEVILRNLFGGE